ncbi:hypothetical protein HDV02_003981 [Globomyces sp. JEL0801]|nr:hypothetical protein HDV02_003981 [Globomyces sp. JEL0801]
MVAPTHPVTDKLDFLLSQSLSTPAPLSTNYTFEDFLNEMDSPASMNSFQTMAPVTASPMDAIPMLFNTPSVPMTRQFSTNSVQSASLVPDSNYLLSPPRRLSTTPSSNGVSKKRKDGAMTKEELLAEKEEKRRRNTESARKSRAKKMDRLAELEEKLKASEHARVALESQLAALKEEKAQWLSKRN